jgi:hypothetical protein
MSDENVSDFIGDIQIVKSEHDTKNTCEIHSGQTFTANCVTCGQLVCLKCIVTVHNGHTLQDLSELHEKSCKIIQQIKTEKIEKLMLPYLVKEHENAAQRTCKIKEMKEFSKREIEDKYLTCVEKIDRDRDKLLDVLESDTRKAEEQQDIALERVSALRKDLENIVNTLQEGSAVDVIQLCRKLQSKYEENFLGPFKENVISARKSKVLSHPDEGINVLGTCHVVPELEVYGVFQTSLGLLSTLRNLLEDETWIGGVQSPLLFRLHVPLHKHRGAMRYEIRKGFVYSIAFTKKNTVALMSFVSSHEIRAYDVRRIDDEGVVFINTKKLFPLGIEVSQNGDVYACASERYSNDVFEKMERGVLRISKTGQLLNFFQFDLAGKHLFHYPSCLTENIDGTVCVIDRHSNTSGRVVALNNFGQIVYTYERPPSSSSSEEFDLKYITHDRFGNVIISDSHNNRVHMISKFGSFISIILGPEEEISIRFPTALHADIYNNLWIGCHSPHSNKSCQVMKIKMKYL